MIHNDVTCDNTLIVPGADGIAIIDFGDLVHAPLISDVAVTVSEVILAAPDPIAYLDKVSASTHGHRYKQLALELLALQSGHCVLDVGCGPGDDVVAMAERVGPTGRAVGIDSHDLMVEEARRLGDAALAADDELHMGWVVRSRLLLIDGDSAGALPADVSILANQFSLIAPQP